MAAPSCHALRWQSDIENRVRGRWFGCVLMTLEAVCQRSDRNVSKSFVGPSDPWRDGSEYLEGVHWFEISPTSPLIVAFGAEFFGQSLKPRACTQSQTYGGPGHG